MVIRPKSIVLFIGGAIILLVLIIFVSIDLIEALLFAGSFNLLIILLLFADFLLSVKPQAIRVERLCEHRFSLGAQNPVHLIIENRSEVAVSLLVKDEPPFQFQVNQKVFDLKILPRDQARLTYYLYPPKRGDYHFGNVNVRLVSRFGFFMRQFKISLPNNKIKVYPNIIEIRKYQLLSQKGFLNTAGLKPAKTVGLGTDFESLRDYQTDDEYRRINWGATARRGRLVTNQYEVDKSQHIMLVLDTGRMMSKESIQELSLLDHAINASLLLGYVAVHHDDKIGLVAFSDKVNFYLVPQKGKPQLQKLLAGLYNLQPEIVESDYQAVCQFLHTRHRKRSLICIFTDLIDEQASQRLLTYVSALTGKHLVMCITLLDNSILEQAQKTPESSQELYEKGVALSVLRRREQAAALLKDKGVVIIDVPAEHFSVAVINKYLEIKAQARL